MLKFLMINFDAYFDNVITLKLIQTKVVLILHVNPLCCSNFMPILPNGVLTWSQNLFLLMACLFCFTNIKYYIHTNY
jgi:hypothetical protein